jgi:hypothetical protein
MYARLLLPNGIITLPCGLLQRASKAGATEEKNPITECEQAVVGQDNVGILDSLQSSLERAHR